MAVRNLEINSKDFLKFNFLTIISLIILHIIFQICNYFFNNIPSFPDKQIYHLFNLDAERNIATAYAATMIFVSSLILYISGFLEELKKNKFYYYFLSGIFFFIGWDELFSIHESILLFLQNEYKFSGFLYHAWVIPYGALTFFVAVFFYRFVYKFPRKIKNLILFSGFIFVLGELIFETFSGKLVSLYGDPSLMTKPQFLLHFSFITIEESLGLIGILIFNFALLKNLQIKFGKIKIQTS